MASHDEQKNTPGSTTVGSVLEAESNPQESSQPTESIEEKESNPQDSSQHTEPIEEKESNPQDSFEPTESIDEEESGSQSTATDSTDQDVHIIFGLRHAILHRQKGFAASGYIDDDGVDVSKLALYFTKDDGEAEQPVMVKFPLTDEDATRLYDAGKPSPFGRGGDTVIDETYRQAHEIRPPYFALSDDLITLSSVLNILPSKINVNSSKCLVAKVHKLNAYATGGFFKPHRDTPRGQNHIGTLNFCLPSKFTGGELVIRQDGQSVRMDPSDELIDPDTGAGSIFWSFLYADCEHEVLPVKSGIRFTISYDVYLRDKPYRYASDSRGDPLHDLFDRIMHNKSAFVTDGGELAFGLRHSYARDRDRLSFVDGLEYRLKGIDGVLMEVLDAFELDYYFLAAYKVDGWPCDVASGYRGPCVLVSEDFNILEGAYVEGYDGVAEAGAVFDEDLIWVTEPRHFEVESDYVRYGNEATAASVYSAPVLVVKIPPTDERPSRSKRRRT